MSVGSQQPRSGVRNGGVGTAQPHDSALKHAMGRAIYIDDMPEPERMLHVALVLSPVAYGELRGVNTERASCMPGVVRVLTANDIPGKNDIAPILADEPLFAIDRVVHAGQPVAAVLAESLDAARAAAAQVELIIAPLEPVLTVAAALQSGSLLLPAMTISHGGDVVATLATAPHRLKGSLSVGGQEHFYLEGQVALAIPNEDGDLTIHASSQHPTEAQHICARLLGWSLNRINVVVRRMGGGFGGKESNASWAAGVAAVAAALTGRPVKLRLPREIDMIVTGKRHGFDFSYEIGFDGEGRVQALDAVLAANGGSSVDMTPGVVMRALTHVDNAYFIPCMRAVGYACKTNTVSNTAFRGFGVPQGILLMEDAVERIARHLRLTPETVRRRNFYSKGRGEQTPYGQYVADNLIEPCYSQVLHECDWEKRRAAVDEFNRRSPVMKRGLGSFALKYGISFNAKHLNQAGALVSIYTDGSIRLNHGGTEMGQGLFIKVAQIVAEAFSVDLDRIKISPTATAEVPNTSPTAASTGSDLNGAAAYNAALTIRQRMIAFAANHFDVAEDEIEFCDNHVHIGAQGDNRVLEFGELAKLCWFHRVSLSATGFYKTPDSLHWNPVTMKGEPFFYYAFGAAMAEVEVDTLTGESWVLRAELVQDCGRSLNPAVDIGQIEGAFAQGLGWLLFEELWWDKAGHLRTRGPSTYKIPGSRDMPADFKVSLLHDAPARVDTIFRSKGVGEPPILLATPIWTALRDAIGSLIDHRHAIDLDLPATPERVLTAITALNASSPSNCKGSTL